MANLAKFNTRVQLKFDTWANWNSTTGNALIPLKGEVCICEVPANTAATGELITEKAYLLKVGDGVTSFGSLPWLSALAADVHSWAKKSESDFKTWLNETAEFATDSELSAVYDLASSANSTASANATALGKTWKTTSLVTASSTNTSGSIAGTAKSGNSDLNIAGTDVAYIIFDCGSSTENV